MFNNQYLITQSQPIHVPSEFNAINFGGFYVYTHSRLKCSVAQGACADVLMLGIAVNPFQPSEAEDDIVQRLANTCKDKEAFFEAASEITGRYILVYMSEDDMVMVGDPCHLRQMFYGQVDQNIVVTSSVKLFLNSFGLEQITSPEKQEFMNSELYKSKFGLWYGDQTPDDRLRRLLANHYLDLRTTKPHRLPVTVIVQTDDEDSVIRYSKMILENTFESLLKRYKLMVAITAGLDSRALLAASRKYQDQIKYYILHDADTDPSDISVSQNLTEKIGVEFSVIPIEPLRQDFIDKFTAESVAPIVQPGLVHIQHYHDQKFDRNIVNVNGNAAEIVRSFYGHTSGVPSIDTVYLFSKYGGESPFVRKEIEAWYDDAKSYAQAMNIPLLDLFYWEQRMSIWGAMYRAEQDLAMEEIAPFNNRKLLMSMLTLKPSKRVPPKYQFFKRLISSMWPETMCEPINPNSSALKLYIKSNAFVYSTYLKLTSFVKSFK